MTIPQSSNHQSAAQNKGLCLDLCLCPPPHYVVQHDLSLDSSIGTVAQDVEEAQPHEWCHHQTTDDVQALEDEVTIIPPILFAQVRKTSKRNHSQRTHESFGDTNGIFRGRTDVTTLCTKCRRKKSDACLHHMESEKNIKEKDVLKAKEMARSVPAVSKEPVFGCPICMNNLIEPCTTKCGHIFCKECLKKSLKSFKNRCPNCRQKITKGGIFRVYLPINYT